ncbi:hypothetical protein KAR48_18170 [bacterium]|nr:hypothetical protein [bacterium]
MQTDNIHDSTRYVVAAEHHGSIVPNNRMEMWRDVYLNSGANVKGGIWCGTLNVMGPDIKVEQSLYSKDSITISFNENYKGPADNVTFASCVTTRNSILIEDIPFKVRFESDIYLCDANLSNALILGNIYGKNVLLRNCIVLGSVYCTGRLTVENSMLTTFECHDAILGANVSLIFPFAIARKHFKVSQKIRSLMFFDLHQHIQGKKNRGAVIGLGQEDIFKINTSQLPKEKQGKLNGDSEAVESVYYLSIAERLVHSDRLFPIFLNNRKLIEILADHHILRKGNNGIKIIESGLWRLLENPPSISQHISESSIDELSQRFGV